MKCPKCGTDLDEGKSFCPKCGANVSEKSTSSKKIGIIVGVVLAIVVLAVIAMALSGPSTPDSTITVNNLKATTDGYGLYEITGTLIPDKDYDYLEMVVVFYDSSGAIIEKNPLAWNMNGITEGQSIKINGIASVPTSETPAKAEVYFFDSVFSGDDLDSAIYQETLGSNGGTSSSTSSSSTDTSSSSSSSSEKHWYGQCTTHGWVQLDENQHCPYCVEEGLDPRVLKNSKVYE